MVRLWGKRLETLVAEIAKSYSLRSLVVGFILTYRLAHELIGYAAGFASPSWIRPVAVIFAGFAGWWLLSVLAASQPLSSVKARCEQRPYVTSLTVLVFALALPPALLDSSSAGVVRIPGALEKLIYHSLFAFFAWLLLCVVSEEIWRIGAEPPPVYRQALDAVFSRLPLIRRIFAASLVALTGLVLALFFVSLVVLVLGGDVRKLGW